MNIDRNFGQGPPRPVNYTVFTYDCNLCDLCLEPERLEINHQLPNVTCSGCSAVFEHRSITSSEGYYTMHSILKADFQFHRYGGLCSACRAPLPGQTHFEHERVGFVAYKDDPLRDCFPLHQILLFFLIISVVVLLEIAFTGVGGTARKAQLTELVELKIDVQLGLPFIMDAIFQYRFLCERCRASTAFNVQMFVL